MSDVKRYDFPGGRMDACDGCDSMGEDELGDYVCYSDYERLERECAELRKKLEWQPIETAPKDGTIVDLWVSGEFAGRRDNCSWGFPHHTCGESGVYCDSEWHDLGEGWYDTTFNQPLDEKPTNWMPLPEPPL